MPACSPRHAGVTGEELEIPVWQNLAQLVGDGRAAQNWSSLGLVVIFSNIHVSSCATSVVEETTHV